MLQQPLQNSENFMPFKLVQMNGNHAGNAYIIPAHTDNFGTYRAILGRSTPGAPVEVSFNEPHISRKHAELIFNGETLEFRHLSQSNPSIVNSETIEYGRSVFLKINDIILLANIQFRLTVR
jgi:hypothetical protein